MPADPVVDVSPKSCRVERSEQKERTCQIKGNQRETRRERRLWKGQVRRDTAEMDCSNLYAFS